LIRRTRQVSRRPFRRTRFEGRPLVGKYRTVTLTTRRVSFRVSADRPDGRTIHPDVV